MIQIKTIGDQRIFSVPQALVEVALDLFGGQDSRLAIYSMARSMSANDFHTAENIAINCGHAEALKFSRERLIVRKRLVAGHEKRT
jgi:hypothetical protein